ncbi:MAG: hypothetical protein NZM02_00275 [Patescibacteria group bacterium]|nr:hypothetical protein [Patescibacteria group bacterium]
MNNNSPEQNFFTRTRMSNLRDVLSSELKHPDYYLKQIERVFGEDFFIKLLEKTSIIKQGGLLIIHDKGQYSKKTRFDIEKFLIEVDKNPQGNTSIDPTKNKQRSQELRAVNLLNFQEGENARKIVVKSTGTIDDFEAKDREDLIAQFFVLRGLGDVFLERDKSLNNLWFDFLRPVKVYGVISERLADNKIKQHLIMEYGGSSRLGYDDHYFDPKSHIELVDFIKSTLGCGFNPKVKNIDGKTMWSLKNLTEALERRYGVLINTLRSRNIIWEEIDGKKKYRIIDLKPQYLGEKDN